VTMSAKPIQVHSWKVHPVTDRHQKPCSPETGLQPGLYMELEGPDHTPLSARVAGSSVKKRNICQMSKLCKTGQHQRGRCVVIGQQAHGSSFAHHPWCTLQHMSQRICGCQGYGQQQHNCRP
jgi:hypothetical protein